MADPSGARPRAGRWIEAHFAGVAIKLPRVIALQITGFAVTAEGRVIVALPGEADPVDVTDRALVLVCEKTAERPILAGEAVTRS